MNSKDNNESAESRDRSLMFQGVIDSSGKLSAIFLGVVYVCGFLTLNSYFYKYGVIELGVANTDYLVAGSLFVLYIVTYALFGGRAIVFMRSWMVKHIEVIKEKHAWPLMPVIPFVYSYVDLVFFHCLSAAIFSSYAFGQYESFGFYAVLGLGFFITYFLDITNLDVKYPLSSTIIELVIKSYAVYSFFNLSAGFNVIVVFVAFSGFSFYINMVLDQFDRYKVSRDRAVFTFVFSVIFFLGSAVTFGAAIYGNVSKKIGGGKSVEMEIGLYREKLGALGEEFGDTVMGHVIFSSQENVYLKKEGKTIVLPREAIQWMRFKEAEEKGLLDSLGIDMKEIDDKQVKEGALKKEP